MKDESIAFYLELFSSTTDSTRISLVFAGALDLSTCGLVSVVFIFAGSI